MEQSQLKNRATIMREQIAEYLIACGWTLEPPYWKAPGEPRANWSLTGALTVQLRLDAKE